MHRRGEALPQKRRLVHRACGQRPRRRCVPRLCQPSRASDWIAPCSHQRFLTTRLARGSAWRRLEHGAASRGRRGLRPSIDPRHRCRKSSRRYSDNPERQPWTSACDVQGVRRTGRKDRCTRHGPRPHEHTGSPAHQGRAVTAHPDERCRRHGTRTRPEKARGRRHRAGALR